MISSFISSYDIVKALSSLRRITFEVTDKCNLACKYCIYGDKYEGFGKRYNHNLSISDAIAVLDYLVDLWDNNPSPAGNPEIIISFYGGEPLLNIHLIQQIVEYVEHLAVSKSFLFSITSNCVVIDLYMDYLVEKNFHLLCSLDGDHCSNGYRVFPNGSQSFSIVYNNIQNLRKKYPEYYKRNVSFNAVLHNLNSIPEVYSFFNKEFNKVPGLSKVSEVGLKEEALKSFDNRNFNEQLLQVVKENPNDNPLRRSAMKYIQGHSGNYFTSYVELLKDDSLVNNYPTATCMPFGNKMFITVDGLLLPCEQIPRTFSYGNVKDGVVDMDFKAIADKFNYFLSIADKRCNSCMLNNSCDQCLYKINGIENETMRCNQYVNEKTRIARSMSYTNYIFQYPDVYKSTLQ